MLSYLVAVTFEYHSFGVLMPDFFIVLFGTFCSSFDRSRDLFLVLDDVFMCILLPRHGVAMLEERPLI